MQFMIKWGLRLIPALALAMPAFTPAFAQLRQATLSDSQEPGSVLVFPFFIGGRSASGAQVNVDGAMLPRTEIEVGAVCPATATIAACQEHTTVKVRAHWVCPGSQDLTTKAVCEETSFEFFLTINGKVAFSADGTAPFTQAFGGTVPLRVAAPQCKNGYLIAWVVNNGNQPIKFDGLIGDAVVRGPTMADSTSVKGGFSTAVSAYPAIPIQANTASLSGDVLNTGATAQFPGGTELILDGTPGLPGVAGTGTYQRVTQWLFGDVKFDNEAPAHAGPPTPANAFNDTFLIFLTLDVDSGLSNAPTFVPLQFFNESKQPPSATDPSFENPIDDTFEFLCWGKFKLSAFNDNLTQANMGTRKGLFIAGPATKGSSPFVVPEPGDTSDATLLGLVMTVEGTAVNSYQERSYIFVPYNNSLGVDTEFEFEAIND